MSSDDSWFAHPGGGALFGIWLGAYYAAGRLGAQLDEQAQWFKTQHDEELQRLDRQLAAESERLAQQLDHDRRMRDRDELRSVLDELARGIAKALDAILDARHRVPGMGVVYEEGYKQSAGERKERLDFLLTAQTKAYELALELQRLRLRFGLTHPITRTFNEAQSGLMEIVREINVDSELWTQEQGTVVDQKMAEFGVKNTAFIEACRQYTDVEIE